MPVRASPVPSVAQAKILLSALLKNVGHGPRAVGAVLQVPALHCLLVAAVGLDEASQRSTAGSTRHGDALQRHVH